METFNNVYTPYIGANGNWYINNEDTGVKAQGLAGPQGPVGPSGQTGTIGAQGLIGPKGEVGDRGPQGIQGPTGSTGTQGLKGDKGDKGDTGLQGEKGDTPDLAVDLQTTVAGKALDATMGKALDDKIVDVKRNLNYSRFNTQNSNFTIDAPNTLIPIVQTVVNADSANYLLNLNGTMNIMKAGLYYINASVHGVINPNDHIVAYLQTGANTFYGDVSNSNKDTAQQFFTTFGGFIEVYDTMNLSLLISSGINSAEIFGTSLSGSTYLTITRIK